MSKNKQDRDFEKMDRESFGAARLIPLLIIAAVLVVALMILIFKQRDSGTGDKQALSTEMESTQENDTEDLEGGVTGDTEYTDPSDPQRELASEENGAEVDMVSLLSAGTVAETDETTYGIDVAKYQGTIDWAQVAASGIDFAMVRVGYRTQADGVIHEDSNAAYNIQQALANGIHVGAYFFSTAVSEEEAIEEADWTADFIAPYSITYPVAYNSEGFNDEESRQYGMTVEERSDAAIAFLNRIYERGYTPMFYAAKSELLGDAEWLTSEIESTYRIWVAQYPVAAADAADYSGIHAMWQYTNRGNVAGIKTAVDINVAYFGYAGSEAAHSDETPETAEADPEANMSFNDVNETVTAKQETNLRDIPSQDSDSSVVAVLQNGDTATRTGVSNSGWSRLTYNGQVCYAVSNYLTTDLSYTPPASTAEGAGSGDGLKTQFTAVNDSVTAKIEVNLRALPSVTNPDAVVVATLHNGEVITRTGINNEFGWSRVDYNGQTLYCISSYLTTP